MLNTIFKNKTVKFRFLKHRDLRLKHVSTLEQK